MSAAAIETHQHRVTAAVTRLHAELDDLVETGVWTMSPAELAQTLPALTRLRARVGELELRVAHHADRVGLGTETGAADTTAWWANITHQTKPETHRLARLAHALDYAHEPVRDALAAGDLLLDQAQVIIDAVEALPNDLVDPELIAQAETQLIVLGRDHDAKALRILGRRILDVIAPEIGEEHERRVLEQQEENARKAARFTMGDDGHGQCHGRFTLPSLTGAMLKKALLGLAAPKHQAANPSPVEQRAPASDVETPTPLRMGQAFAEYVERYPVDQLPHAGGVAATVVVTMDLETLLGGLKSATTDLDVDLSPGEARRLACEAGIIPAVLGGASQVLDIGRKARFHTSTQRIALALRDQGCTAVGCDWPPGMCHAHHDQPWSHGGGTSVANGRLLCPRHHTYAHHPAYQTSDAGNGKISFHRRT